MKRLFIFILLINSSFAKSQTLNEMSKRIKTISYKKAVNLIEEKKGTAESSLSKGVIQVYQLESGELLAIDTRYQFAVWYESKQAFLLGTSMKVHPAEDYQYLLNDSDFDTRAIITELSVRLNFELEITSVKKHNLDSLSQIINKGYCQSFDNKVAFGLIIYIGEVLRQQKGWKWKFEKEYVDLNKTIKIPKLVDNGGEEKVYFDKQIIKCIYSGHSVDFYQIIQLQKAEQLPPAKL